MATNLDPNGPISTVADLDAALANADAAGSGAYEIDLASGATIDLTSALEAINLQSGVTLDIVGNGATIDGQFREQGLFVYAGQVTISDLTVQDAVALGGAGGSGSVGGGGGGGAGLGGGLFVGASVTNDPGQVTLNDVTFANDSATGGNGGYGGAYSISRGAGGGGGLGGQGGSSGGGGGGIGAAGGSGQTAGLGGNVPESGNGGGAGGNGAAGGSNGGGGGGAGTTSITTGGGGGGGGGGGQAGSTSGKGGAGGYGGGGGGSSSTGAGGQGGYGGGGGGGASTGGNGGFGGGGGSSSKGSGGQGGFGAGSGASKSVGGGSSGGGGGLGAGGDIFVQNGASLTIGATSSDTSGSTVGAGVVNGGSGATTSGGGGAYGSAIFLDGMTAGGGGSVEKPMLGKGQVAGQTTTISGVIADEAGSVSGAGGAGALVIQGDGTVVLAPADANDAETPNTFTGGVELQSGTLELASSGAAGTGTITFEGAATLAIDGTALPTNTLSGLAFGDVIDLTGVADANGTQALSGAQVVADYSGLNLDEAAQALTYNISSDGAAGTDIAAACYCRGTQILTERGEIAVEDLRVGDVAVTAGGRRRPVIWLGWRDLDLARHPRKSAVWPVRVCAGAFGDNLPQRDLWVSPGHNVHVDGVLIPAIALVNGATIEQVEMDRVSYHHVELDAHDILLAENLPAESYLDCGNRSAFANADGAIELFPDFLAKVDRETCYPIRKSGAAVEAAKALLLDRAESFGFATTREPGLRLVADGAEIAPLAIEGSRFVFAPPAHARDLRLASRIWTPSHMRPESADDRRLGVLVTRLDIDGARLELAALDDGWAENQSADWRWTLGLARLPSGARTVAVEIEGDAVYWDDAPGAAATLFGFAGVVRGARLT